MGLMRDKLLLKVRITDMFSIVTLQKNVNINLFVCDCTEKNNFGRICFICIIRIRCLLHIIGMGSFSRFNLENYIWLASS